MIYLIIFSAVLGYAAGHLGWTQNLPLQEISAWVILVLKTLATPLLFFSILDAFSKTKIPWRKGLKLVSLSSLNAAAACLFCLIITEVSSALVSPMNTASLFNRAPATSRVQVSAWLQPNLLKVALVALLLGGLLQRFKSPEWIREGIHLILTALTQLLRRLIQGVPIAVFCAVAHFSATPGGAAFEILGGLIGVVTGGLLLQLFCYYPFVIALIAQKSPFNFFRTARPPILTALSTGSSLATLPVTLPTLENQFKVSAEAARLVACVGTHLNHDGIILYEACAALYIAQLYGISLNWVQKLQILGSSVVAAIGVAGVPEAGLITLSLVLSAAQLPTEIIPLLLSVDWLMGRLRAMTNVTSDLVVAIALGH